MASKCRARLIVAVMAVGILSAGCSSGNEARFAGAQAALDPLTSQIDLPLEAYAMTQMEMNDVAHANAVLMERCLAETGRDFPRVKQNWDTLPVLPDRRYGIWSSADAETNGYELPPSSQSQELSEREDSLGADWWLAYESCLPNVAFYPAMGVNSSPEQSPVDRGMNDSFDAMVASQTFDSIRGDWKDCIVENGVAPNNQENYLVPSFPPAGEEQLRIAGIDVRCKESVNVVQQLGDFEARHQMAFIAKRESELVEYRAGVDEVLVNVRETLASDAG